MVMTKRGLEAQVLELLARPYRKVIRGDPTDGYLAEAPELPGCVTAGETEAEALELLRDAMAGWFETRLVEGLPIPEPDAPVSRYSGRILLRTSPHFHQRLSEQARAQGVSLNQWLLTLLAESQPRGPLTGKGAVSPEVMASPSFGRRIEEPLEPQ